MKTMSRSATYQVRLDENEKQQAFDALKELGITPSQAIRMFLRQVVVTRSIPFPVSVPNDETVKAIEELEQGQDIKRYKNADDLFASLGI